MGAVDLAPGLSPGVVRLVDRIIRRSGDPAAWEAAFFAAAPVEARWAFSLGALASTSPAVAARAARVRPRAGEIVGQLRLAEHFGCLDAYAPDPVAVAAWRRAAPAEWKHNLRRHLALDGLRVPIWRELWT